MPRHDTLLLAVVLLFLITSYSFAQNADDALRITNVQFAKARSPYGGDNWLAATVSVQVKNNPDRNAPNRNFIDHIKVNFAMAINSGSSSAPKLKYFWSEVETATLERGTQNFRFYLSPAIVKRYKIGTPNPYAWVAEITSLPHQNLAEEESALQLTATAVSPNLKSPERLARFQQILSESKPQQSGILLAQRDTPFRDEDPDSTPILISK